MALDYDLSSIQEARDLARKAKQAYEEFTDCCEKSNDRSLPQWRRPPKKMR